MSTTRVTLIAAALYLFLIGVVASAARWLALS